MNLRRGKQNESSFSAKRGGFSLVELLIVIVIMGILARLAIVAFSSAATEQLRAVAQVVASDLNYARSLAIGHNSNYRVEFDVAGNRLVLRHTGTDAALNTLPSSPFRDPSDPADQQITRLAELPIGEGNVRLVGAQTAAANPQIISSIEFGPYGETTQPADTIVWLMTGIGDSQRYLSIQVSYVTGLTTLGQIQGSAPVGF